MQSPCHPETNLDRGNLPTMRAHRKWEFNRAAGPKALPQPGPLQMGVEWLGQGAALSSLTTGGHRNLHSPSKLRSE